MKYLNLLWDNPIVIGIVLVSPIIVLIVLAIKKQKEGHSAKYEDSAFWVYLIAIVLLIASPLFRSTAPRSPRIVAANNARLLLLGCRAFAGDHDENYPKTLDELYPDYVDDKELFFCDDKKGRREKFIYLPGFNTTSQAREPIIVSPFAFPKNRVIVGYAGGHVVEERIPPASKRCPEKDHTTIPFHPQKRR